MSARDPNDEPMDSSDEEEEGEEEGTSAVDIIPPGPPGDFIKPTKFSTPYRSIFSLTPPNNTRAAVQNLEHAPCSYTCTPGLAPSLLELKQHAHDLVCMIKYLTISTVPGIIDGLNAADKAKSKMKLDEIWTFEDGETFDFLNDLTNPYTGPGGNQEEDFVQAVAEAHKQPLTSLLNVLEEKNIPAEGEARPKQVVRNICPLHRLADLKTIPPKGQSLPYATHQSLIKHANDILELLDHEYSAKGGILAILPTKAEKEDREKAESTLLGQMILYTQRLVQRLHDLERLYANAMDVIAGEAVVPPQALSRLGPDGRSGRELVYPQDRFVLANAGEDVWNQLSHEFDKKDRIDEVIMDSYRKLGVTGEMIWQKRGGQEMDRGITAIDVTTRYYRMRGTDPNDPKTIFIIPAYETHPGTKVTRDMEQTPTVVTVVKPVWPERASLWEQKHRVDMDELKKFRAFSESQARDIERKDHEIAAMRTQYELRAAELRREQAEVASLRDTLEGRGNENKKAQVEALKQAAIDAAAAKKDREEAARERKEAESLARRIDKQKKQLDQNRDDLTKNLQVLQRSQADDYNRRVKQVIEQDRLAGEQQLDLANKLKSAWQEQIIQTQILMEQLLAGDALTEPPSAAATAAGKRKGQSIVDAAVAKANSQLVVRGPLAGSASAPGTRKAIDAPTRSPNPILIAAEQRAIAAQAAMSGGARTVSFSMAPSVHDYDYEDSRASSPMDYE
ncbi:hypothetical protein HYFRA_00005390 [Hymenoscyphus fraxineus]|uniref:Uncharacterized protein n=1 Tax=Hymenoscyphus fraxineus TaxID=746836 RepID=A0A9N9LB07_9HELO|nr:hypothetical protein HYFRA_00005390 [Hymenoscyphus fraxineus]